MSATFACPHCGATYPRKPVLVGRAVRCTTCKNAFSLREDGIADKIEMPAPAAPVAPPAPPAPAPQPAAAPPAAKPPAAAPPIRQAPPMPAAAPPRPAPRAAAALDDLDLDGGVEVIEPATRAPAPAPAKSAAKQSSPLPTARSSKGSDRLTAQQQEARRQMAATLATSMSAALQAESVKRDVDAEAQKKKKAEKAEGGVGKIGPAILTGQGVEEAKTSRRTTLVVLLVLALGGGLGWLLLHKSPQQLALAVFTDEVDKERIKKGERVQAIQERAWLVGLPPANVGVPPVISMMDARIGAQRSFSGIALKEPLAKLKGLAFIPVPPLWAPADKRDAIQQDWTSDSKLPTFVARWIRRVPTLVSHQDVLDQLGKAGLTRDDADIVDLLLRGRTDTAGGNALAKRLLAGDDLPARIEVAQFSGNRGLLLMPRGNTFRTTEIRYRGQLLRFVGPGWPEEWKVLTLTAELITP
jgi:hypothetical protein